MNVVRKEEVYKETYTIEDIYALQEGERAELIDGQIYYMAPPSTRHQRIVSKLNQVIANHIDSHGGDCEVFPSPFAVFLNNDDINYVEPDISVICDPSKLDDKGCHGAPDWIIEIVSPGSKSMDYYKKLLKYNTAGVKEYWIVDPTKELVMVYRFDKETMDQYSFGEDILVGIYDDFSIRIS
ncbi:Uma2 family endonuclease [Lachnospiraceae bacterium 62-26]